jgi:hypothetical protein
VIYDQEWREFRPAFVDGYNIAYDFENAAGKLATKFAERWKLLSVTFDEFTVSDWANDRT